MQRRSLLRAAVALAAARFTAAGAVQAAPGRPRFDADPFGLGVASGEPRPDGFVLWTRCPGARGDVALGWEVAEDEGFRRIAQRGRVTAPAARGGAAHVQVRGLRPGRPYWYRFQVGGVASPTGRTLTLPLTPARLRLALASCQHWEHGWFSAYRDMLDQDVDAILHVGDYIYEYGFGSGPDVRSFGAPEPRDLDGFRARYALYRTDPDLRRAHAETPFIVTWDDHEVQNDYAGPYGVKDVDPDLFLQVRTAAYQAYFEHMPLSPAALRPDGEVRLYRRFAWGDLAHLHVLDTRQYRDVQPCLPANDRKSRPIASCTELERPDRTMLGRAQEAWLSAGLAQSPARWTLLGQQTLFSRLALPEPTPRWGDFWDGYPAAQARLTAELARTRNPVVLGGDLHSFWLCDVPDDAGGPAPRTVATEIVTTCLASRNGPDALFEAARPLNPHVRFLDNAHAGYALLDITAERISGDLRVVSDLADPAAKTTSLRRFDIADGRSGVA